MTKAIVSAYSFQLLHERNIQLDETLDQYFDNYSDYFALVEMQEVKIGRKRRRPHIYQLLNHTSRLSYFSMMTS